MSGITDKINAMGTYETVGGITLFESTESKKDDDKKDDSGGCDCKNSGQGIITFDSIKDLQDNGIKKLTLGDSFRVLGYYAPGDYGAANYVCKYIWSEYEYPWAIDLGESTEPEYQLDYNTNGYPKIDEDTNEYVLKTDTNGNPIPVYEADGVTVKKKHYYAIISDTVVNYAMFGARLDGETDDYQAIYLAHAYQSGNYYIEPITSRKKYYIKVANHKGIIRKDNNSPIICSGDIDLSGSELLLQNCNAAWYGFYLWGDNDSDYFTYEPLASTKDSYLKDNFVIETAGFNSSLKPNAIINVKEDPYAIRDDAGYLYSVPRYELLLHTADGVLSNPFMENWNSAGGMEIIAPYSDYVTHEKKSKATISTFEISYTMIPASHYYFTGCDVKLEMDANEYCTVLWCKCHNSHIKGFNFIPSTSALHNTVFKNTMIYLWGAYNVEVSDIVGFNAAGKKENGVNGGSGYVLRATNCLNVNIHDISVQGYWGATAMNCVKDIHVTRVYLNRLDIHNYFYNLYVDQCNFYNHAIQIGEGRGMCQITNSNFYINNLEGDSYPNAHMVEFNATYGRVFCGKLLIDNCNAYIKDADGDEFDVCKMEFSPEAVSILEEFKFPETTIRNCYLYAYNPATYLVYFMIAGTRNCKTATAAPTNLKGYCRDTGNNNNGSLVWQYIGRGFDWIDTGESSQNVVAGQIIRTYSTYKNEEDKTVFYDKRYFLVTSAGTLPTPTEANKPSDYSGAEFTISGSNVKVKYVENCRWTSNKTYSVNDIAFTETSNFMPVFCYRCVTAGTSNGYRPVHTSGTVIDGVNEYPSELDSCWWAYCDSLANFVSATYTSNMAVTEGQIIYVENRLYKVTTSGNLDKIPPTSTNWTSPVSTGTAEIQFIGKDWDSKTWWQNGCYCVSTDKTGAKSIYQLTKHDGITSGDCPIENTGRVVDGDIIWQNDDTLTATSGTWMPEKQYYEGDIVSYNNHKYKCVFDGRLEMPHQIVISNVASNMTAGGDVFAFYSGGTDVPTKCNASGKWTIKVDNVEKYRFVTPASKYYFGHSGNPDPTIIEVSNTTNITTGTSGTQTTISIDTALDADSENPVQNKIIYAKIKELEKLIKESGSGGSSSGGSGSEDSGTTYLSKTVTQTGTDIWLDSTILDVPEEMTKLKITVTSTGGGSCTIKAVTDGGNWVTTDNLTKLANLSTNEQYAIFNVASGRVRPIINYYEGTDANGTLTVVYEGSSVINNKETTLTMPGYTN